MRWFKCQLKFSRVNSAGDTIIEVLIAIAVVSAVLGSAFPVAQRMHQNARQAQEHVEALKLLEGQLEQLREYVKTPGNEAFTTSNAFCFSQSNAYTNMGGGVTSLPATASSYPAACNAGSIPGGYHLGIIRGANNVFTAKADWDGPAGSQEEVSLIYRLFP